MWLVALLRLYRFYDNFTVRIESPKAKRVDDDPAGHLLNQ